VRGRKVRLYDVVRHRTRGIAAVPGKPGEICDLTDSGIEIALQGGWLEVRDGRIDGSAKVPAAQLAATLNLAVGTPLRSEAA
jgi:methionyl-tRNA formyltransferase